MTLPVVYGIMGSVQPNCKTAHFKGAENDKSANKRHCQGRKGQ